MYTYQPRFEPFEKWYVQKTSTFSYACTKLYGDG